MRKLSAGILAVTIGVMVCAGTVFAGGHGHGGNGAGCHRSYASDVSADSYFCSGGNCADEDGDFLCDRCGRSLNGSGQERNFADENNDGVCDYCGKSRENCSHERGYTDSDNDGVCDYCWKSRKNCSHRRGYTDADNGGVCGYYGSGSGQGHHGGHGSGCHGVCAR